VDAANEKQFEVCAIYTIGPVLSIRCLRCRRWSVHIDEPLGLDQVNQRSEAHLEDCSVRPRN